MSGRMIRILAVASIVVVAAAACSKTSSVSSGGSGGGSGSGPATLTIAGQTLNNHGSADASSGTVSVSMNDYYFSPTVITGSPGQKVRIELKNSSGTTHNFSVSEPGLNVSQDVSSGGAQFVTVNIPASGAVVFFCKFHQGSGMRGALEVAGSTVGSGSSSSSSGQTGGTGNSGNSGNSGGGSGGGGNGTGGGGGGGYGSGGY